MDELLDAVEAGRLLKLHPKTIARYARRGLIPGARIGREWRFTRAALEALVPRAAEGRP